MTNELTCEILLLVEAVSDGLLSFDLIEITEVYLSEVDQDLINCHINKITDEGLVHLRRGKVIGLSDAGHDFLS
ncbi:hypothetical protein [Salibacterium halotolerans]|uniref:Uncharacterized protein n=1 Tax=Salibacterium halotolerans TaxID=1884432 RepID=A0A1I5MIV4_9BACI|nr:hypothetical protein [Salibacterium halotolerans]SFP09459.1 hypothetical protein SAMN05518683_102251 [Salibacterium halotolerans]